MESLRYPIQYNRLKTRVVRIGKIRIGGDHPVCIQSMLTSATNKPSDCISEIKSLNNANCELIRLAIPSQKDLDAIPEIKRLMKEEGIEIPLVADIHFSPKLALEACEFFEKIRINPGNYSDSPKNAKNKHNELDFKDGYLKLKESIHPLTFNLKKYKRALRIGVNQGSLSRRMMERYGDSPRGMVQSALELISLLEEQDFDQIVVSLKSSNPIVVQKAYRLLIQSQSRENTVALHLGVTEAGNGIMGRIKSLAGIVPLLMDGIGDTIRVSLTEPGANEIDFAREILGALPKSGNSATQTRTFWQRPLNHQRVDNQSVQLLKHKIGGAAQLKIGRLEKTAFPETDVPFESDFIYRKNKNKVFLEDQSMPVCLLNADNQIVPNETTPANSTVLIPNDNSLFLSREYYKTIGDNKSIPVGMVYPLSSGENKFSAEIKMAAVLSEGLLDYLLIPDGIRTDQLEKMLLLLQATRSRLFVTDYIICPSCGRTLFDIESTAAKIKKQTHHLKGIKIGIMGCIVNGPGEMADADFGYVGAGTGKVDLFYGEKIFCKGIAEENAVEELIKLIKEKGMWVPQV